MKIPKLLHHIWVGPLPPPTNWMKTWPEHHPDWEYRVWGNDDLAGIRWHNRKHMDHYAALGRWDGVADLMRYEILFEHGGVVLAADSICLRPIDDLFDDGFELYAINTGEYEGGPVDPSKQGATTPLYAAAPGHLFTKALIKGLAKKKVSKLRSPARSTGNWYMRKMIARHQPPLKVWPMHLFIPEHFNGWKYRGPDMPYARHLWGTTRGNYDQASKLRVVL